VLNLGFVLNLVQQTASYYQKNENKKIKMNTKKITFGLATLLLASATIFSSCKKEKNEEDSDTASASDNSLAQQSYNDLGTMADEAVRNGSMSSYNKSSNPFSILSNCATLTWSNAVNFATDGKDSVTVDFGTVNCACNDGRQRRGQVRFVYTGAYRTTGTVITITPINYFVNDNQVQGSKTITNNGSGTGYLMRHTIVVTGTVTKSSANGGGTITWNSTRTRDWVSGDTTSMWNDDVYNINGDANGTSSGGTSFTSQITSPLVRKFVAADATCKRYFVQGTIVHTPSGKAARTIDFGSGTCDNKATVTINGTVHNITLP
jgi:hypothetical protein